MQFKDVMILNQSLLSLLTLITLINISMNLGVKPPPKQQIQILDRKTDHEGKAVYKIRWTDNGIETWEYLKNLNSYYKVVSDFEKQFQNRPISWTPLPSGVKPKNTEIKDHSFDRYLKSLEQRKKESTLPSAKPQTNLMIQNPQAQSKHNSIKHLIRIPPNVNINDVLWKRTKEQKREPPRLEKHRIKEIMKIYSEERSWFAEVLLVSGEIEVVLRDELRMTEPKMLLNFYQNLLENRKLKMNDRL